MAGEAKRKAQQAKEAATTNGRVPISIDTTLRLSRLWFELKGAEEAMQQAQAGAAAKRAAYVDGLSGVVEALDLGVDVLTAAAPDGSQRLQVGVDFKARELVLPAPAPGETKPTDPEE